MKNLLHGYHFRPNLQFIFFMGEKWPAAIMLNSFLLVGLYSVFGNDALSGGGQTAILEVVFAISALVALSGMRLRVSSLIVFSCAALYVLYSFLYAYSNGNPNIFDFIVIYKAFFYFSMLSFFAGKSYFDSRSMRKIFRWMLLLLLIRYSYEKFYLFNDRPNLITENNYELIVLVLLYYRLFLYRKVIDIKEASVLMFICLISGSKSGMTVFIFVTGMTLLLGRSFNKFLIYGIIGFVSTLVLYQIFADRLSDGLENIDRFRFLQEFFYSMRHQPWWRYLIGNPAITPLDSGSCSSLAFYNALVSFGDKNICYSVMLHSYILRAIYDHGVFGLLVLCIFVWMLLGEGYTRVEKSGVIFILLLTGVSVSSFNNVYVAIGLSFFVGSGSRINCDKLEFSTPVIKVNRQSLC